MCYLSHLMYDVGKVIMFDIYFYLLICTFIFSVIEIPVYDCSSTAIEGILNVYYFCISLKCLLLLYLSVFIYFNFLSSNFSDSVLSIHIVPCESQPMELHFE